MDARRQLLDPPPALPNLGGAERADASRNRTQLLDTARGILSRDGVEGLTMDRLAREAGLGKGTIFRRFGSRSGLLLQLLNEIEADFQRRFMSGPPPLGPGADPLDRLVAFGRERLALLGIQGDLLRAAEERPDARYGNPAGAAGRMHVRVLLQQAGFAGDAGVQSFNLMASLEATLVLYENRDQNITMERLAAGWEDLVRRLAA